MNGIVVPAGGAGTAVAAWDPNSGAALPAYLADALGDMGSNIPDRNTVPSLSYEGKTWAIVKDGNKTKLQTQNADGDMVPVPIMRMVILNFNADRGRSYYEGTYNPAASTAPKCWSPDGKAPDASVREKVSPTCTGCPMSVKGSKVDQGREMVACSQHRMVAIVPAFDIDSDPLRMKIAVTSDYDKEIVEHGWYAFRQYVDFLKSRGIAHTGLVVTKVKFDPNTAYPKLLFSVDRVLTPEEIAQVKAAIANPKVTELLAEKWTAAGAAGTPVDDSDIAPQPDLQTTTPEVVTTPTATIAAASSTDNALAAALADGWQVHPDNGAYSFKGSEVITNEELAARYAPAPAPAPAPAAPPAAPAPVVATVAPLDAAVADGWTVHPDNGAYYFKGSEVLDIPTLEARYAGNAASAATAAPATPAPAPAAGQTATTAASPSDAAIPADVQNLLNSWSGA